MPTHVVAYPDEGDRLGDISSADNQKQSKVPGPNRNTMHVEQDRISNSRYQTATNDEAEAVAEFIAENGACQGTDSSCYKHWNTHNLCVDRGPTELLEDGRSKK